jgi:hypothetical protein
MRGQEKIHFTRGTDEHMNIRKESNMFNSTNQQNPKMNKYERKE